MSLLSRFFRRPLLAAAAANAILAEHTSGPLHRANHNPLSRELRPHVIAVFRSAGFSTLTEAAIAAQFNGANRIVQLNLIAMALDRSGRKPSLRGEEWRPVSNPFVLFPGNETKNHHLLLARTADRLVDKHNVSLNFGSNQTLWMDEIGIWDGGP